MNSTLSERLRIAMGDEISASDLARACGISHTAVSNWLNGYTLRLSADNLAAASRALGVREEWLRTGREPREREHATEERDVDRAIDLLLQLREPLTELLQILDRLQKAKR